MSILRATLTGDRMVADGTSEQEILVLSQMLGGRPQPGGFSLTDRSVASPRLDFRRPRMAAASKWDGYVAGQPPCRKRALLGDTS